MLLVCEPVCEGHEHVELNAGLLAALRRGFDEPILFAAEPAHLGLVAERLAAAGVSGIASKPLGLRSRLRGVQAAARDGRVVRDALRLARAREARAVVFSSTSAAGLFALKLLAGRASPPCLVVPHGALEALGEEDAGGRWFPLVLRMRNPPGLRYLLLSPAIERDVLLRAPSLAGATFAVDHPYLMAPAEPRAPEGSVLRFGSLGRARRDGLAAVVDVARDAARARPGRARFAHVGPVADPGAAKLAGEAVALGGSAFLSRERYEQEIAGLDYALFLSPPDAYRFSVAGSFLDALSLLKPVIALRNPFFEHCFEEMGDIGYLCDTVGQAKEVVRRLCARFPKAHYLSQQEVLALGREAFSPEAVGASLRDAFTAWEAREVA